MTNLLYGANVNANGIRQHYLRYGGSDGVRKDRDPVIVIPGITSPAITWGFVGEHIGACFDTYILDVRGRGLSEASDSLDYGINAQADDVLEFAKALGLSRYSLVGHSMGARIGMRALRRGDTSPQRLVMVDPPVSGPGRREYPSKLPWYIDSMAAARKGMDADAMRAFCATWTEEQLMLRAEWLHTCDERAIRQSFDEFHTDDFHADIPHVTQPVLLVRAGKGGVILDEDVAEMQSMKPDMLVSTVANAGHMIPWDDEPDFYRSMGDFLGATIA
jgi:N-formylmaleamate deformylase